MIEGGDLEGAEQQIELAGELDSEDALSRLSHLAGRGRLHLLRQRPDEALADFIACGGILGAAGAPNPSVLPWRSGAARALWVLGDHDEARLLADEELSLARDFGAPGPIGRALRTLAGMEEGRVRSSCWRRRWRAWSTRRPLWSGPGPWWSSARR